MNQWSKWSISRERQKGSELTRIRRYRKRQDGKPEWQTYPREKYAHLKSESEIERLVEQLNHRVKSRLATTREAYQFKHRFITQDLLDGFREKLVEEISDKTHARHM